MSWGMTFPDTVAEDLLELVRWQVGFGVRYPGSPGHLRLRQALADRVRAMGWEPVLQPFEVMLDGAPRSCANVVARVGGKRPGPVLLLGTHWDTRLVADRDPDPALKSLPIPGANDGGSGTAVLLELLEALRGVEPAGEVQVAFLDAEDVGNLDGNEFSRGAEHLAGNPLGARPDRVLALDMVGGKDMVLDRDAHAARHPPSLRLTSELFAIGREQGWAAFTRPKAQPWKYIISDHYPFLVRGIPAAILIDIDYPPWHTHRDLPEAMDGESLAATLGVVATYIERHHLRG